MLATHLGVFLLSMAGLCLEITLTRIFSLAQWYHFAFMAVSIALLGFGASGSFLSLFPSLAKKNPARLLANLSLFLTVGILVSYLNINYVPFDSYRIAWEREQILFLAIYYLLLTLPFFFSGLAIGVLLAAGPELAGKIYFLNLAGSALGCLAAVASLPVLGGAGTVMLSALLGALAAIAFSYPISNLQSLISSIIALALLFLTIRPPSFLEVHLSPYKGLSQALLYPGAEVVFSRWNAFSRVDVIESQGVKSAPGLSLAYPGPLPTQLGLFIDGDNLSPITGPEKVDFVDYLPVSLPYRLRPQAKALIIESKGGLDVLAALHQGASSVTAVESNPLVVEVARDTFADPYRDERVTVVEENGRSYVRRVGETFDVVQVSLADTYRPVTSGAYSLSENYLYTVEAFADYLARLSEDGLLVVSRWLQTPPSESLRAGALAVTVLEKAGLPQPERRLVAIRSWSTLLLLVKNGEFTSEEIEAVRSFCRQQQFDLVYYPGIQEAGANRYNVYPEPLYYRAFQDLLFGDRARFYADYAYDVSPTTDDRPFFFHFFKWSQTPEILQTFGKIWQPFGGSGYFVLVALLILALLASAILILLPLLFRRRVATRVRSCDEHPELVEGCSSGKVAPFDRLRVLKRSLQWRVFAYFAMLGFGYLFVEIPLMQHFILFLGHPIYAFAAVLFAILLFSGLGSMISARLPLSRTLMVLIGAIILYPLVLPVVFRLLLGHSLGLRLLVSVLSLAPLGFLMGVPFPRGIEIVGHLAPDLVPWAWGINGCTSVLASILSAMLAISFGFSRVLVGGSVAYLVALGVIYPLAGAERLQRIQKTAN
jgi:spermidine synthase